MHIAEQANLYKYCYIIIELNVVSCTIRKDFTPGFLNKGQ